MIIKTVLVHFLQDLQLTPPKYKEYVDRTLLLFFFNIVLNKQGIAISIQLRSAGDNRKLKLAKTIKRKVRLQS